jgi:1-deoxy-D-xylulose-5-phosphate reductoisomerase
VAEERGFRVAALAAGSNAALLEAQARRFRPRRVALADASAAERLARALPETEILAGEAGVLAVAAAPEADIVLDAAVGIAGLRPALAALNAKKPLALANKECLVCAGAHVMAAAERAGVPILSVDSEHSAIFQCMQAGRRDEVRRVILTASGGPFYGYDDAALAAVTVADALNHPSWAMGAKITVDSATMMNKGFEMIEARWLFGLKPEQIEVVVHRQSIIHSLVEFLDGAVIAQLSPPDMGLPIQVALDWPQRYPSARAKLDLAAIGRLTFNAPDAHGARALELCRDVMRRGGNLGAALSGGNEAAVALFLAGKMPFHALVPAVADAVAAATFRQNPTLDDLFRTDAEARAAVVRAYGDA